MHGGGKKKAHQIVFWLRFKFITFLFAWFLVIVSSPSCEKYLRVFCDFLGLFPTHLLTSFLSSLTNKFLWSYFLLKQFYAICTSLLNPAHVNLAIKYRSYRDILYKLIIYTKGNYAQD